MLLLFNTASDIFATCKHYINPSLKLVNGLSLWIKCWLNMERKGIKLSDLFPTSSCYLLSRYPGLLAIIQKLFKLLLHAFLLLYAFNYVVSSFWNAFVYPSICVLITENTSFSVLGCCLQIWTPPILSYCTAFSAVYWIYKLQDT